MTLIEILNQVAEGKLSPTDAEVLIRKGPPHPPMRRGRPKLVGGIFLIIGSVFVLFGGGWGIYSWSFTNGAQETDGIVIQLVPGGSRGGVAPVVRYQVGERNFEVQSGVSTSPPAYSIGETVKVLYHTDRPEQGRIYSFVEFWLFPVVFGGFGSLFSLIGIIVCFMRGPVFWRVSSN